jgi:hypothetical protein
MSIMIIYQNRSGDNFREPVGVHRQLLDGTILFDSGVFNEVHRLSIPTGSSPTNSHTR